jgi:hypothetical protein
MANLSNIRKGKQEEENQDTAKDHDDFEGIPKTNI